MKLFLTLSMIFALSSFAQENKKEQCSNLRHSDQSFIDRAKMDLVHIKLLSALSHLRKNPEESHRIIEEAIETLED